MLTDMKPNLNEAARLLAAQVVANPEPLRVAAHSVAGATVVDCGIAVPGGLRAGLLLARLCLADQGEVSLQPGPVVQVHSDDPVRACMASQYAGWQVQVGKFFAMGSG